MCTRILKISGYLAGWIVTAAMVSCGSEKPPAKKPRPDSKSSGDGTAQDPAHPSDPGVKVAEDSPFALVCSPSVATGVVGARVPQSLAELCAGPKVPTTMFAKALRSNAFSGLGTPALYRLHEPTHDAAAQTTELIAAASVKLHVKARVYAEKSLGYYRDPASAKTDGIEIIAGLQSEDLLSMMASDPKQNVLGGSSTHIVIQNVVNYQNIISEYEADHLVLSVKDDQSYILLSQATKSIRGIQRMELLSVVMDLDDGTYLFTVMETTTNNRNQPGVAAEILGKLYRSGSINVYNNARKMNGEIVPFGATP